jgi:hypothetical protein
MFMDSIKSKKNKWFSDFITNRVSQIDRGIDKRKKPKLLNLDTNQSLNNSFQNDFHTRKKRILNANETFFSEVRLAFLSKSK